MCFPFIYFDLLSDVILNKKEESKMISFINNISEYQTYLMYVEEVCGIKLFEFLSDERGGNQSCQCGRCLPEICV